MSGDLLQRARLLRDHRRFEDAIAVLHGYLAAEPGSFSAFHELAVTRLLGGLDYRQGLEDIEQALAISPDSATAHATRSALLHAAGRFQDALTAANSARRLDPEMAYAWFCEGNALLAMEAFPGAERAARKALELEPDHSSAPNLLTAALRCQRRFEEAEQVSERHLQRNPEDAWTLANAGWNAFDQGLREKAENNFREALRLKPEMELARLGLRDAFKSRSFFYRLHLRLTALHRKTEVVGLIGFLGMVGALFSVIAILMSQHPLAVVSFVICFLLIFGPLLADSIGHLLLLKDRFARHSLNRGEQIDCLLVGGLLIGGMLVLSLGAAIHSADMASLGGATMGAAVPASFVFLNPSKVGRIVFGLTTLGVVACGLMSLLLGQDDPDATVWVVAAMLVVLVSPRISMLPALRTKKAG